jgi:tetratricopeptide (TPR) repeat protein
VPEGPKREVSEDATSDYKGALAFFNQKDGDKKSWGDGECRRSAENFESVARSHPELVEAQYMAALSYHRCGMVSEAQKGYEATLRAKPNHAPSLSNLGQIYFAAGKTDAAKQNWNKAIELYPKLVAAYVNRAALKLEEMRTTKEASKWAQLDQEAQRDLSTALAVDSENIRAYTVYAMVFMEGRKKNKNRLDLAKLLMDEAEKRNANYAPLKNARGLFFLYRNAISEAIKQFEAAVQLDPKFTEARMNVALANLGFRRYDAAKEQFSKVIELDPKRYDALVGLGIALRGQGDFSGAEAQYKRAKGIDGSRGEAIFNLGVLYKDFLANKQTDMRAIQTDTRTARDYFRDFLTKPNIADDDKADAKNNITDCDKIVTQLDEAIKMGANQPAPPAPAAAAPTAPAKK